MKVRELQLYTEKVEEQDIKNFLKQVVKARLPFLGFIDLSGILSLNFIELIIKRTANTITFFAKDKPVFKSIALLTFPFRFSEPMDMEPTRSSFSLGFYILTGDEDFISFMLKGNVVELRLGMTELFGGDFAVGCAIDEKGKRRGVIVTNPSKFLRIDLEKNPSVYIEILEPLPKRVAMVSAYPVFEETGTSIGLDNFDPLQHTLTLGASGTGKSKFLYIMIKALEAKYGDNVRIVIIDPHAEFIRMFPKRKIVNFIENYIEPLDVSGQKTPLMSQLITQLIASSIGEENKYAERVIYYVVNLLLESDNLTLTNISAVLTDPSKRAEFTSMCTNAEVKRFFDQEYNDIYIHNFNVAVLPILNFIGEYELHLGGERKRESLLDLVRKNRITVISFNPHFFGHSMIRFLAGAVINQMYILALTENFKIPTVLVIDELPRVEVPAIKDILAETRKFNLYAYLSSQYLAQLSKRTVEGIISNIRNIVAFKLNRDDAALISSITEIRVEEYFKKHRSQSELEESKREMFVRLHQRECIARLFDGTKYLIPMRLKVVDVERWKEEGAVFTMESEEEIYEEKPEKPERPPGRQVYVMRESTATAGGRVKEREEEGRTAKVEESQAQRPEISNIESFKNPLTEERPPLMKRSKKGRGRDERD